MSTLGGISSAQKNIKRSKDEIKLFELCVENFSCVVENNVSVIKDECWDADIILRDMKIAILWNGPWHYKEMKHSNHSLKQVQTRDKIKIRLFEKHGWTVLVFEDRYYTPDRAFDIIKLSVDKKYIRELSNHGDAPV